MEYQNAGVQPTIDAEEGAPGNLAAPPPNPTAPQPQSGQPNLINDPQHGPRYQTQGDRQLEMQPANQAYAPAPPQAPAAPAAPETTSPFMTMDYGGKSYELTEDLTREAVQLAFEGIANSNEGQEVPSAPAQPEIAAVPLAPVAPFQPQFADPALQTMHDRLGTLEGELQTANESARVANETALGVQQARNVEMIDREITSAIGENQMFSAHAAETATGDMIKRNIVDVMTRNPNMSAASATEQVAETMGSFVASDRESWISSKVGAAGNAGPQPGGISPGYTKREFSAAEYNTPAHTQAMTDYAASMLQGRE